MGEFTANYSDDENSEKILQMNREGSAKLLNIDRLYGAQY